MLLLAALAANSANRDMSADHQTVLVVDDNSVALLRTSSVLERAGFRIRTATTGTAAAELAAAEHPSLVVLDIGLPDIDGLEVCRRIKADPLMSSIPVLHLSAVYGDDLARARGLDNGADAYLTSPANPEVLVSTVRALLRMRAAEQRVRESEQRFRIAAAQATDLIYEWHSDTGALHWFGPRETSPGELKAALPATVGAWEAMLHEDDRERAGGQRALHADSGEPYASEYRVLRADGAIRDWSDRATRVPDATGGPVWIGVITDMTEARKAERALREHQDRLRELALHLQELQERERARLAYEVREDLGQLLAALKWQFELLRTQVGQRPELRQQITRMVAVFDQSMAWVRRVAAGLRPGMLDCMGLEAAVRWQAQQCEDRSGIRVSVRAGPKIERLEPDQHTVAFRVCEELLENVVRHAKARRAGVRLEVRRNWLSIRVSDDGVGIRAERPGGQGALGLLQLSERAVGLGGRMRILGSPGRGTTVQFSIPARFRSSDHRA